MLEALVQNRGGPLEAQVRVLFTSVVTGFTAEDTVMLHSDEQSTAHVPFASTVGTDTFIVIVDPDTLIEDGNRLNNRIRTGLLQNRFNTTPEQGVLNGEQAGVPVGIPRTIMVSMPAGAVESRTVMELDTMEPSSSSIDMAYLSGIDRIFRIAFDGLSPSAILNKPVSITLFIPYRDSLQTCKPYRWDETTRRWLSHAAGFTDSTVTFETDRAGFYCVRTTEDQDAPHIEIQVQGQPFVSGGFVPRDPVFSCVIQDSSGVDTRSGSIRIFIDGNLLPEYEVIAPDSIRRPTNVGVVFRPQLSSGEHHLSVMAGDIHGNIEASETYTFRIESVFDIQFLGNHPNPFRDHTVFVYVLTDAARRVSLKIYTVSGRLIRSFEDPGMASADYHEVMWDGRDAWGDALANGVYFFRLKVDADGNSREVTGKIALYR